MTRIKCVYGCCLHCAGQDKHITKILSEVRVRTSVLSEVRVCTSVLSEVRVRISEDLV